MWSLLSSHWSTSIKISLFSSFLFPLFAIFFLSVYFISFSFFLPFFYSADTHQGDKACVKKEEENRKGNNKLSKYLGFESFWWKPPPTTVHHDVDYNIQNGKSRTMLFTFWSSITDAHDKQHVLSVPCSSHRVIELIRVGKLLKKKCSNNINRDVAL